MLRTSLVWLVLVSGCGGAIPEPIYANQVDAYFPESEGEMREEAEECAARLNGHRSTAEITSILQGIINGIGGAASSAGGVLGAVFNDDTTVTTAMGTMSAIGSGLTLIGNLIIGFVGNPVEELRRHGDAQRSWEMAVELDAANGDQAAVRQHLERCQRDEAPPVRVEGTGPAFSR